MIITKKISVAGINSIRGGFKVKRGDEGFLPFDTFLGMRVMGITHDYNEKVSDNMGVSYQFLGEFRAWNREGTEFASPVCYLPEPAQGILKAGLDGTDGSVEFGFDVFIKYNKTAILGYEFLLESLLDAKPSEGLAHLVSRVHGLALRGIINDPINPPGSETQGVPVGEPETKPANDKRK